MATVRLAGDVERELRLTIGSLRRFERRSGVKLFKTLAKVLKIINVDAGGEMSSADGMTMFTEVFPGIDEVSAFLYECCVSTDEQKKLSFEKFCDDIPMNVMPNVFSAVMSEIADFMPAPTPGDVAASKDANPLES